MFYWQIDEPKKIEQLSGKENIDSINCIKIKIKQALLTQEDFDLFQGVEDAEYPVIPSSFAVGEVSEVIDENSSYGLKPLDKIYLNREATSLSDDENRQSGELLKDFVVANKDDIYILPPTISLDDAIYIEYISMALKTFDKLDIQKGEHVAVIGGGILGNILAQIINYHQGVPIIIDNNEDNLKTAEQCGIYYTTKTDADFEKYIKEITGGRMVYKIVYLSDSHLNSDISLKLARKNANIAYIGFGKSNIRLSCSVAMKKQLSVIFVNDGTGYTETAINLIANKALNFSRFSIPKVAFSGVKRIFENSLTESTNQKEYIITIE